MIYSTYRIGDINSYRRKENGGYGNSGEIGR